MTTQKNKMDIADLLYCSSMLEENTFLLYKKIAEKMSLPMVKSILFQIAFDSHKHSTTFRGIVESIAPVRKKPRNCDKMLGAAWNTVNALLLEFSVMKKISSAELPYLTQKLNELESVFGEEYNILVQLKTLQYMTKEINKLYNVNLRDVKSIFERIIDEEEHHIELLSTIKRMIAEKPEQELDNTPMVKYQNPDAWNR
jgi:rubrerythrin